MSNLSVSKQEYLNYLTRKQIGIAPTESTVSNTQFVLSSHIYSELRSSWVNPTDQPCNPPKKNP